MTKVNCITREETTSKSSRIYPHFSRKERFQKRVTEEIWLKQPNLPWKHLTSLILNQGNTNINKWKLVLTFFRTFGDAWISMLKVHEIIGNQRIKFAAAISDAAEDLVSLGKSIEKERKKVTSNEYYMANTHAKQVKEVGLHYEKMVTDAETQLEKVIQYGFAFRGIKWLQKEQTKV